MLLGGFKNVTHFLQGPGGHIKPIPDDEDFVAGAPPATGTQTGTDREALDRALAVRLQQARFVSVPGHVGGRGLWASPTTPQKLCAWALELLADGCGIVFLRLLSST